jgi:tetratricopeptide (TPR) repeat protein
MAEAHAELGATLRELRRVPEAVAALNAALALAPSLGEARLTLAMCLEDQGDLDGAAGAYRAAARALRDDATAPLNLGLLLAGRAPAAGTPAQTEALQSLREAVRRGDRDAATLAAAGPALRRLGDAAGAVRALDRARTLRATPVASELAELAQAHYAAGQAALADLRIGDALRAAPRDAALHYVRGLLRAAAQDRVGAAAAFREVLRLAPTGEQASRARARLDALSAR